MIRRFTLAALPLLAGWTTCASGAVAVADRDRLWTGHQVLFSICEVLGSGAEAQPSTSGCEHGGRPLRPSEAAKVREAIAEWNTLFAAELMFVQVDELSRNQRGVLFSRSRSAIRCSTDKVGRPKSSRRTNVKLGPRCNRFAAAETPVGTILHEMMHVAGFYHEQQRPDRDAFLRPRVPSDFVSIWFDVDGATQWAKGSRWQAVTLGPYDFGSIMHYPVRDPRKAVLTSRGERRLELQGLTVSDPGRRDGLSESDIAGIRRLYQRVPLPRMASRAKLESGKPSPL